MKHHGLHAQGVRKERARRAQGVRKEGAGGAKGGRRGCARRAQGVRRECAGRLHPVIKVTHLLKQPYLLDRWMSIEGINVFNQKLHLSSGYQRI